MAGRCEDEVYVVVVNGCCFCRAELDKLSWGEVGVAPLSRVAIQQPRPSCSKSNIPLNCTS